MLELALHYIEKGWPVFPLNGKVPAIPKDRGGHGCLDATLDPTRVEAWWAEYPDANIGIATGERSGLLVVDVDPRKTDKWLASLRELFLPKTFTVHTCSGGWHLYFALPAGAGITIGADLLPGIDWRGSGGYVVGAGSSVNGSLYTIAKNLPISGVPKGLLERIHAKRKFRTVEYTTTGDMVIPASRRNDTLVRIAGSLRRWGIEHDAILESLRSINANHCNPVLADAELEQIATSVVRYTPSGAA